MTSRVGEIRRALLARGFRYVGQSMSGDLEFVGSFAVDSESIAAEIAVSPIGLVPPKVRLKGIPARIRTPVLAHITQDGNFCYLASESVVLDVFDVPGQTLGCIDLAQKRLLQVLRGELTGDIAAEFFAYWCATGRSHLLDADNETQPVLEVLTLYGSSSRYAFASDTSATVLKLMAAGLSPRRSPIPCSVVTTNVHPRVLGATWPPTTVGAILGWQRELDRSCGVRLEKRFKRWKRSGLPQVIFLIQSPQLTYGFKLQFSSEPKRIRGIRTKQANRKQLLAESQIIPFNVMRIDSTYIARRSVGTDSPLVGKKILLVGCGTIGGYLAELLVKAGAGLGGGEMLLVDNQILLPANVGRHRLGFESIQKSKAEELVKVLCRGMPSSNLRAAFQDVLEVPMAGFDLIVNSTGEEALGALLAQRATDPFIPTVTVWIEGAGVAIRGVTRDSKSAACPRCLVDEKRMPRFPTTVESAPTRFAGHGCESLYVPFPATVSVQAACLGAEMVADWVSGNVSPRLRTRILDRSFTQQTADLDPSRMNDCPACAT